VTDRVLNSGQEVRALHFEHDAQGRLLRRALTTGGRIAETDTWTLDGAGRATSHVRAGQTQPWLVLAPDAQAVAVPAPTWTSRWQRIYDQAGRVIDELAFAPPSALAVLHRASSFDAAGRLLSLTTGSGSVDPQSIETWAFDPAGHETLHTVEYPAESGIQAWYEAHGYDKAGQAVVLERGKDPEVGPTWREVRTYECQ
jgi:hypothetical protein